MSTNWSFEYQQTQLETEILIDGYSIYALLRDRFLENVVPALEV